MSVTLPQSPPANVALAKKPANAAYQKDVAYTLKHTRWLLRSLGLWAYIGKHTSIFEKITANFINIFFFVTVSFPIVPTTMHAVIREMKPQIRVLSFGPMVTCITAIGKYVYIILRRDRIVHYMDHMESDWMKVDSSSERAIMIKYTKVGHTVTFFACAFMYMGGIFYNVICPLLRGKRLNENNETVRSLVYQGFDLFVDPMKTPNYEIILIGSCFCAYFRYTVTIASCNLAALYATHACGQMRISIARLKSLFEGMDDEKEDTGVLHKRIAAVIHCHVRGLTLTSGIEDTLREVCLIEVFNATFLICLLEYYCMTEWSNNGPLSLFTYTFFLIGYIFNVFILCYIGELLKEQCIQVGMETYQIEWYRLPGRSGLALIMILAMANYPRKLTAGAIMELSVATFGSIIKTSLVYLNLLREMGKESAGS